MKFPRTRRDAGRLVLAFTAIAGLSLVALTVAHPAAATTSFERVQSAVSCATTAACVSGSNTSTGPGVSGTSKSGDGVVGTASRNSTSLSNEAFGVAGYDKSTNGNEINSGVYGQSTSALGVRGYSSKDVGVYGEADKGLGMYGVGNAGGVFGISAEADGVDGQTNSAMSAAVNGMTAVGEGGYFESQATTALEVVNDNATNPKTSQAILATTNGDSADLVNRTRAILATNTSGDGAEFAGSYIGLIGRAPTSGYPMDLVDENYDNLFIVDGSGNAGVGNNLTVDGNLVVDGKINPTVRTAGGSRVNAFMAKTAAPTIEDTGTANLIAGAATVRLDPVFAGSIDGRQSYRVFVTPDGDTNGLYVAAKTASGFTVREIHGGHSTLSFDYRIVATAWGESGQRAAIKTESRMAPRVLPVNVPKVRTAAQMRMLRRFAR